MRKEILNYRNWSLFLLVAIGGCALIAIPTEETPLVRWVALLLGSKAVSLLCLYIAMRLYERWSKRGKIELLTKLGKEE